MAKVNFQHTSAANITTPTSGMTNLFYDTDKILKQKDEYGNVSPIALPGSAVTLYDLSVTNTTSLNILSANTMVSGSTNLYDIFITTNDGNDITRVQPGTNITTGGTGNNPVVSLVPSPSVNAFTASGDTSLQTVSATTMISGSTNLYSIFAPAGTTGSGSNIQPGSNIVTGGTPTNQIVSLASSISVNGITASGATSLQTVSATTMISGSTDLYNIFLTTADGNDITRVQPGSNINTGGTPNNPVVNLNTNIAVNEFVASGTSTLATVSATTIISGGTNLYGIFAPIGSSVQPGLNTYTGGTVAHPSVNISAATLNNLSVSGASALGVVSATTMVSGSTDLYNIFLTTADGNDITRVQPGTNTTTGGTPNAPTVNLASSISVNGITASGATSLQTVSATTIISGSTNLYSIFQTIGSDVDVVTSVQGGTNITTGGTATNPTINLVASPSVNNLTVSGNTNVDKVYFNTGATAGTEVEGKLYYDSTYHTLSLNSLSGTNLQIGQENWTRIIANEYIADGDVVYFDGSSGIYPTAKKAIATSVETSRIKGIATQNINSGETGFITTFGIVHDLNTTGYTGGDLIYLSASIAGKITNILPVAPNIQQTVGRAIVIHPTNGSLYLTGFANKPIGADHIDVHRATTNSTYHSLTDLFNTGSVGQIAGGVASSAATSTVSVTSGSCIIAIGTNANDPVVFADFPSASNLFMVDQRASWICVKYNSNNPIIAVYTGTSATDYSEPAAINYQDVFPLAYVTRQGTELYVTNNPRRIQDAPGGLMNRFHRTLPLSRDERTGGLILGETGTRNITVSAGALFDRQNRFAIDAINTSGAGSFSTFYRSGATTSFVETEDVTQWPNTQYDLNGVLTTVPANRFANQWWYLTTEGYLAMVYGRALYTSASAAALGPIPSTLPLQLNVHARLIARVTFQGSAASYTAIDSAFANTFGSSANASHNNLSGLQGGSGSDYYHLSSADYTNLTSGNPTFTSLSASSISASTLYSGSTNLYSIFLTTADGNDITRVQPGSNITTGGTGNNPVISLAASPSVNAFTASGATSLQTVSATTIISGSTNLYSIFVSTIIPGANIIVGSSGGNPVVRLTSSPSISSLTASGSTSLQSLSATNIYDSFLASTGNTVVMANTNGMLYSADTVDISSVTALTINNLNITSLSAGTIYSGSTNLYQIFTTTGNTVWEFANSPVVKGAQTIGTGNIAGGNYSVAEGKDTYAKGDYTHTEGSGNTSQGGYSHSEGLGNNSTAIVTHMEGAYNSSAAKYSHVAGIQNTLLAAATGSTMTACSGKTADEDWTLFAQNIRAYGNLYSNGAIFSAGTNLYNIFITSGSTALVWSAGSGSLSVQTVGSSCSAIGISSVAEGFNTTAIGDYSHSEGASTTAIGSMCHTEGQNTIASGDTAHAEGNGNKAFGVGAHAEGMSNITNADYSHIGGYNNYIVPTATGAAVIAANTITGYTPYTLYTDNVKVTNSISASTIYSGSTNLYSIFATIGSIGGVSTSVQPGSNITTGGTATVPIINLVASPSVNGFTASGTSSFATISATTIYSGSTNLYSIFAQGTIVDYSGQLATKANLSAATFTNTVTIPIATSNLSGAGYVSQGFAISDETTAITSGTTAKVTYYAPFTMVVSDVVACLSTSGSTLSTFDIHSSGATIFSTLPTIDANEFTTDTAAAAPVLSVTTINKGAKVELFIDGAGTGAKGAKMFLNGYKA